MFLVSSVLRPPLLQLLHVRHDRNKRGLVRPTTICLLPPSPPPVVYGAHTLDNACYRLSLLSLQMLRNPGVVPVVSLGVFFFSISSSFIEMQMLQLSVSGFFSICSFTEMQMLQLSVSGSSSSSPSPVYHRNADVAVKNRSRAWSGGPRFHMSGRLCRCILEFYQFSGVVDSCC